MDSGKKAGNGPGTPEHRAAGCGEARDRDVDEARFRALVSVTSTLVWVLSAEGTIAEEQPSLQAFTGLSFEDIRGDGWAQALHPEDRTLALEQWNALQQHRAPAEIHYRMRRHDGEYRDMRARAVPMFDAQGQLREWVGANEDVTETQRAHDALRESESLLRQADLRKDRFLATLAHELRNPLAPIRSGLHILQSHASPPEARVSALAMMDRQVGHMVRLIDDLMDLNRVTSDKLRLQCEPIALQTVLQTAIETTRPVLEAGGHPLEVELPPAPLVLDADLTRLSQVFSNLLHNAAKYSRAGSPIRLVCARDGTGASVTVVDQGIGIAPEMQDRVFEMFAQVDGSLERAQGGLGIGLSLARRLVEMHGGSIRVHSDGAGKGSRFTVCVPVLPEREASLQSHAAPAGVAAPASRRVLVVDDNRDAAESLAMLASIFGHEARMVHDGPGALREAEAFHPQIVLLDIGLPGMNGYDVARALRKTPWGATARIVALTGWGQERDRRQSLEAGFDHHLVKPVGGEALRQLLTES